MPRIFCQKMKPQFFFLHLLHQKEETFRGACARRSQDKFFAKRCWRASFPCPCCIIRGRTVAKGVLRVRVGPMKASRKPLASLSQHFRTARARHAQTLRKGVQLRTLPIMRVRVVHHSLWRGREPWGWPSDCWYWTPTG